MQKIDLINILAENIPEGVFNYFGYRRALRNAQEILNKVPAYRKYLRGQGLEHLNNTNFKYLEEFPITDKQNYIKKFKIDELTTVPINQMYTIESSSGYSGEISYWPRTKTQDNDLTDLVHSLFNKYLFIDKYSTLFINAVALGTWIGGVKVARTLLEICSKSNTKSTAVNVGVNMQECIKYIKDLSKYYDQVIIMGYPPFLKKLIDLGSSSKIEWKRMRVCLVVGGEPFPESYRDYLNKKLGIEINNAFGSQIYSSYGASDIGITIGNETYLSIMLRRILIKDKDLRTEVFGKEVETVPHFFQYNPLRCWIEVKNTELIYTSFGGIPVVRYNLHDEGGILKYSQAVKIIEKKYKIKDLLSNIKPYKLPFIYVFGRSDGTISIDGENIYIEDIKDLFDRIEEITQIATKTSYTITELKKLIPNKEYANRIYKEQSKSELPTEHIQDIINEFKVGNVNQRLTIYIELKKDYYKTNKQLENFEKLFRKALVIMLNKYSISFHQISEEQSAGSDLHVEVFNYGHIIFEKNRNKIKLQYKIEETN